MEGVSFVLAGSYTHTIDAKNRVFMPAKHREKLGPSFIITKGVDKCLMVYSMEEWEKYSAKLEAISPTKARDIIRFIYANAIEAIPDAQGRVLLSPELVAHADLKKNVTIIGCSNHAEIWDADAWAEKNSGTNAEGILAQMIELGM